MADRFAAELDKCKTISLEILQEKVNQLSSDTRTRTLKESDALHYVCTKRGVTVEILEYILEINPNIQYDDMSSRFGSKMSKSKTPSPFCMSKSALPGIRHRVLDVYES